MEVLTGAGRSRPLFQIVLLTVFLLAIPSLFASQDQDEYAVKAAFIFNFSKFVEWPQTNDSASFEICILGDDPFEATIDQLTQGKTAYGHAIQIRRVKEAAAAKSCRIVFVSSAEGVKAAKLVDAVRGTAVLTVGETQEFLRIGGMIVLSMEDTHVNIVINTGAAQNANLKVSAKLLTLAKIYKSN